MGTKGKIRPQTLMKNSFAPRQDQKTGFREKLVTVKLVFMETETLLDYFGGGPATTGLDFGEDWIATGLHALWPNWSYIFTGPVSFTISG